MLCRPRGGNRDQPTPPTDSWTKRQGKMNMYVFIYYKLKIGKLHKISFCWETFRLHSTGRHQQQQIQFTYRVVFVLLLVEYVIPSSSSSYRPFNQLSICMSVCQTILQFTCPKVNERNCQFPRQRHRWRIRNGIDFHSIAIPSPSNKLTWSVMSHRLVLSE